MRFYILIDYLGLLFWELPIWGGLSYQFKGISILWMQHFLLIIFWKLTVLSLEALLNISILLLDVILTIAFLSRWSPFNLYWEDGLKKYIPQIFFEPLLYSKDTIFITYRGYYIICKKTVILALMNRRAVVYWVSEYWNRNDGRHILYLEWPEKYPLRRWYLSSHLKMSKLRRTGLRVLKAACTRHWNEDHGQCSWNIGCKRESAKSK